MPCCRPMKRSIPCVREPISATQLRNLVRRAFRVALAAVVGPTTKILAIGSVTAKGTPEAIAPVLPFEVRATVRNHLAGKIEQWFFQTEGYGVVFIMNCTTTAEAQEI